MEISRYTNKPGFTELRYYVAGEMVREVVADNKVDAREKRIVLYLEQLSVPLTREEEQEYRVAKEIVGGESLIKVANDHRTLRKLSMPEVSEEYLSWFVQRSSPSGFTSTASRIRGFVASGKSVADYLDSIKEAKTHNNVRSDLSLFFDWMYRNQYCEKDHEVSRTIARKVSVKDPIPFTAATVQLLVNKALNNEDWQSGLFLCLGAFAGIRSAEIQRLTWGHLTEFQEGYLYLNSDLTKTNRRRKIKLQWNLDDWINCWKNVCPRGRQKPSAKIISVKNPHRKLQKLAKECGVGWVDNGLRKGYVSCLSELEGTEVAAASAGHSIAVLEKDYKGLVSEEEAERWFDITPLQ